MVVKWTALENFKKRLQFASIDVFFCTKKEGDLLPLHKLASLKTDRFRIYIMLIRLQFAVADGVANSFCKELLEKSEQP